MAAMCQQSISSAQVASQFQRSNSANAISPEQLDGSGVFKRHGHAHFHNLSPSVMHWVAQLAAANQKLLTPGFDWHHITWLPVVKFDLPALPNLTPKPSSPPPSRSSTRFRSGHSVKPKEPEPPTPTPDICPWNVINEEFVRRLDNSLLLQEMGTTLGYAALQLSVCTMSPSFAISCFLRLMTKPLHPKLQGKLHTLLQTPPPN